MTHEEYNIRTNANATEEEFFFLNRVYMAAGDSINKDQFCKDIQTAGVTPTIASLTERVETAQIRIDKLKKEISNLAIFIAEQAEAELSEALREKAIAMMGAREYITWKIENEVELWNNDLTLIKELINDK